MLSVRPWAPLAFGLCLAASPVFGQPGRADDRPSKFVCIDEEGRAAWSEPLTLGPSDRAWSRLEQLAGDRGLTHCWVWTESCPPGRVDREEELADACGAASPPGQLTIRVPSPEPENRRADAGEPRDRQVEIVAAPAAMWRDAPISLLPTWTAVSGLLVLPRGRDRWRVQARLGGRISALHDAPPDERSVDLTLLPATEVSIRVTADRARPSVAGASWSFRVENAAGTPRLPSRRCVRRRDVDGYGERAIAGGRQRSRARGGGLRGELRGQRSQPAVPRARRRLSGGSAKSPPSSNSMRAMR